MTYEQWQQLQQHEEEDYWAWVQQELDARTCSNCIYWQPPRLIGEMQRPAHCAAMAELERECYRTEATNCQIFTHFEKAQ